MVEVLKRHKIKMEAEFDAVDRRRHSSKESHEKVKKQWKELNLVFPSTEGTPLDSQNLNKLYKNILKKAGLYEKLKSGKQHFHITRHSSISLLVSHGVPINDVAALAGHKNILVTLDTYSHSTNNGQQIAMDVVQNALNLQKNLAPPSA